MSSSLAAPSSSSAPATTSFIAWLPAEVIFNIFAYIEEPPQLYHASLACRAWRSTAVDSRLWEPFYWHFYRSAPSQHDKQHPRWNTQRRDEYRRECMRAWLKQAVASSLPADFFRSFLTRDPKSGDVIMYEPLMTVTFAFIEMLGAEQTEEVLFQSTSFAMLEWSDLRPVDPEVGTQMIYDHLKKVFGRGPTPRNLLVAKVQALKLAQAQSRSRQVKTPELSLPHFLDPRVTGRLASGHRERRLLCFHDLFTSRMNRDEDILRGLDEQTRLTTGKFDKMLRLIQQHGDYARDILFALVATQQMTSQRVSVFATDADGEDGCSLRALQVHASAAPGSASVFSRPNCLALFNAAQQFLGHLQRREAVESIQRIRDRWSNRNPSATPAAASRPLRERVLESCVGIEEVLGTMALFRFGEKSEISAYLDDLALHVFANLETAKSSLEAMRSNNPLRSSPHPGDPPETPTTQRLIKEIHRILDSIGFGIDHGGDFLDISKLFIHVPLWCHARRHSHPLIQTAILCAVARRLGVAASLVKAPHTAMAVIVEDLSQLPCSPNDKHSLFFYAPGNDMSCLLLDFGEAQQWLIKYGEPEAEDVEPLMEPASPLTILQRVAHWLNSVREREREAQQVDLEVVGERIAGSAVDGNEPEAHSSTPSKDDLGALLAYLTGQQSSPPWPLTHGVLPSSLAMLPHGPRGSSLAVSTDAECAFFWVFRLTDPQMVHGLQRGDDMIARSFFGHEVGHDNYYCDLALLLGINGCNVAHELAHARNPDGNVDDAAVEDRGFYDGLNSATQQAYGHSSHAQLRAITVAMLARDRRLGTGMGGAGGSDLDMIRTKDPKVRSLLNRAHPTNAVVKYGVGTVFKHRSQGYHAVVVGWDSVCRADQSWVDYLNVEALPQGGRNQPFYHIIVGEDGSRRYVAQCNMEPLRIPLRATAEEASAILRRLVPLLNTRAVGRASRTLRVARCGPKDEVAGKGKGKERADDGGEVTLVMNEWMREAWPFD